MKQIIIAAAVLACSATAEAQDAFKDDYNNFLKQAREEYESFRDEANKAYADFLAAPWESVDPALTIKPKDKTVPPAPIKEYDQKREDKVIKFDEIYVPEPPKPQPKPIEPVIVEPEPTDEWLTFTYLGNTDKVRLGSANKFKIGGANESAVAKAWNTLSAGAFDATLSDCLSLRTKHSLPDWAYLNMLDKIARTFFPYNEDEATLLTAWLFSQSGYQMRLARAKDQKLVLMFGCDHTIYGVYYTLDGVKFYPFGTKETALYISHASYPHEKNLSLTISKLPAVGDKISSAKSRKSSRYPEMNCEVQINENLMDFYNTYPSSQLGDNVMTRWALYANTPLSDEAIKQLYPHFKKVLAGRSERDAVQHLLNWVQTGFVYEYDDKVWGQDRAFFADETLYYPYADCEDRSILFSRLVRDLVGLDVVLVYYPRHLATAVAFNGDESGDWIMVNGRKFIVCDPTFTTGAPVGRTGTGMDNSTAKVILLRR